MKILRVISGMDPKGGGPCQGIRNMVPALEEQDCINEVVSLDAPDSPFLGKKSFPIHALGASKSSWAYGPNLLPWLLEHLPEYDVVIQHGLWQYHGYAVLKAVRQLRKAGKAPRWYIYPHGMLDPWFQKAESRRLKAIRNWIYWKLIENRVIASSDGVLFTCEEEMRLAATTFRPYKPQAVHNVGYGIPEPPDNVQEQRGAFESSFPHLQDKPFLLFLSRIHPKKGVDLLLQAYGQLKQEGMALPPLVIAGPCSDRSFWDKLQSLAVSLGLQPDTIPFDSLSKETPSSLVSRPMSLITWPGMITGDLKWGALRAASAFILPSHQENFGIAVVEALVCGTPVLISNKVNIWREIEASQCGLVEEDTVIGTQNLIENWIQMSEMEKHNMSRHAISCFQNQFHVATAAARLVNILN